MLNISTTREVILTAGQSKIVPMTGTFLRCLEGAEVMIELGGPELEFSGEFPMAAGASVSVPFRFDRARITSVTSQTVKFFSFFGDYRDDTLIASESFAVNTKPLGYDMETLAPVSALAAACTKLADANPLRRYVGLYNEGVETLYIRETDSNTKSPFVLAPGAFLPVPLTGEVWCYNAGASACTVLIAEFS